MGGELITENALLAADTAGLCDETNLDVFLLWHQFGGYQRGLSPLEIAAMPQIMIKDFNFLLQRLAAIRQRQAFFAEAR